MRPEPKEPWQTLITKLATNTRFARTLAIQLRALLVQRANRITIAGMATLFIGAVPMLGQATLAVGALR